MVADGLRESRGWDDEQVASYLDSIVEGGADRSDVRAR
jgi:hypothetical protein